jgi:hypothetical protein
MNYRAVECVTTLNLRTLHCLSSFVLSFFSLDLSFHLLIRLRILLKQIIGFYDGTVIICSAAHTAHGNNYSHSNSQQKPSALPQQPHPPGHTYAQFVISWMMQVPFPVVGLEYGQLVAIKEEAPTAPIAVDPAHSSSATLPDQLAVVTTSSLHLFSTR